MPTSPDPRPRRQRWVERQRWRRQSPLLRLVDQSLGVRLLLAAAAATLALAAVNRWEQCRDQGFARGCVWHDAGGVVSVDNLEAFSIMTAGFLFILEGGQRRRREHLAAMEVILSCQQAKARFSYARNEALEQLSEAGLWLDELDLSQCMLDGLQIPGARWRRANLAGSSLREANLRQVDWQGVDLRGADLQGADLQGADLQGADLSAAGLCDADLSGAKLCNANLSAANLRGAQLSGAQLDGADLTATDLTGTDLTETDLSGTDIAAGKPCKPNAAPSDRQSSTTR